MAGPRFHSAAVAGLFVLLGSTLARAVAVFPDGPPPGHTGGFGEPTCHVCHFDGPLNGPDGALSVVGLPTSYQPGRTYTVRVELEHPELRRAGFQLAIRFAGGARRGTQAGSVNAGDGDAAVVVVDSAGVAYAQHTQVGARPDLQGAAAWNVLWTAPEAAGTVIVHVAANAANDDDSEFGDHVLAEALEIGGR